MWNFVELKIQETEKVTAIFKAENIKPSFLTSPYTLNTFLNYGYKKIYIAGKDGESRVILHRTKNASEVRILFKRGKNDDELIEAIKTKFNPLYIAYNLLGEECEDCGSVSRHVFEEMIIDTKTIAEMADKKIRHAYNYFTAKHPNVEFKIADATHKDKIIAFLDAWRPVFSAKRKFLADGLNDLNFLNLYLGDKNVQGLLAFDGEKVIGISFFAPHFFDGTAISILNKCLRGYSELGVGLYVNKAQLMLKNGFLKAYTGDIKPDTTGYFKRRFLLNSEIINIYAYEIYKAPECEIYGNYLGMIL